MTKIWNPEVFQGRGKKKDYFEGWYFKSVSNDEKIAYAIIAGLSITKTLNNSHSFVMFVDAHNKDLHYYQYPLSSFWANKEKFEIKIGKNSFSLNNIILDMDNGQTKINAQMKFENIIPWPVKRFSQGVMGIYAFIPFLECYHGVLSLNHSINGYVEINGRKKTSQVVKVILKKIGVHPCHLHGCNPIILMRRVCHSRDQLPKFHG